VTNLSGRGVGMDVVKRNITALRGSVELDSGRARAPRSASACR
jgi:two-component system, chemotaxis family, sensor kinase CheA